MTRTAGTVNALDGEVLGHFEFNETVDVARPQIFASSEELTDNWRGPWAAPCKCEGVEVELRTQFDWDTDEPRTRWRSRACLEHKLICGPLAEPEEP